MLESLSICLSWYWSKRGCNCLESLNQNHRVFLQLELPSGNPPKALPSPFYRIYSEFTSLRRLALSLRNPELEIPPNSPSHLAPIQIQSPAPPPHPEPRNIKRTSNFKPPRCIRRLRVTSGKSLTWRSSVLLQMLERDDDVSWNSETSNRY